MTTVAAVKMRYNPKTLWFDPQDDVYAQGDYVLVETERGREVGLILEGTLEVTEAQIKTLKSPLKPVIRKLSDIDFDHLDALDLKGREALPVFREMITRHQMDIKAVQVEYLFSGDKAVFYFASDIRIDFRELVRELAAYFHVRVDMRQIGARDEARMIGGLAHCGEELCCARLGNEFQPVSIRMAKEQDLPLNPVKISGACGRLMCCLRYEFEAYKEFKQRAPKKGLLVQTPLGTAKITDYDTPREIIHMRLEDGKPLSIPLARMDCDKDDKGCSCNCRVSREAIDQCASPGILLALSALDRESDKIEDSLLSYGGNSETRTKRRRQRGGENTVSPEASEESTNAAGAGKANEQAKGRSRRRRRSDSPELAAQPAATALNPREGTPRLAPPVASGTGRGESQGARPRPGQRSSGVRNPRRRAPLSSDVSTGQKSSHQSANKQTEQSRARDRQAAPRSVPSVPQEASPAAPSGSSAPNTSQTHRRRRRRSDAEGSSGAYPGANAGSETGVDSRS